MTMYDFCLEWVMSSEERKKDLAKKFKWNFEEFKTYAKSKNWWVTSMNVLENKQ